MTPGVDVVVVVPEPIGLIAGLIIIGSALAQFALNLYKTQAGLDNWERVTDDADYGARGVDALREEMTTVRAEQTDMREDIGDLLDHALRDRLTPPAPAAPATDEAAAVLVGHWAAGMRPTPQKRARTTASEETT